jgi:hypothetical protein
MAEDELAGLSRDELLDLVRRQQAALAEREAAIERRDEKIRELEEELAQFRRPAKTPENSSVPPSRGQKANRIAGGVGSLGRSGGTSGSVGSVVSRTSWWSAGRARVAAVARSCPRPGGVGSDGARSSTCQRSRRW